MFHISHTLRVLFNVSTTFVLIGTILTFPSLYIPSNASSYKVTPALQFSSPPLVKQCKSSPSLCILHCSSLSHVSNYSYSFTFYLLIHTLSQKLNSDLIMFHIYHTLWLLPTFPTLQLLLHPN